MRRTASLTLVLVFVMHCLALSEEPVQFADANLKDVIEQHLSVDNPTAADMLLLTGLDGHDCSITDLTGIEYATNLEWLDLSWNNISNISALSGLTNLYDLFLEHNQIVDISVLSQLTNLEFLVLSNNGICDISPISGLKQLWALDLAYNQITDISALSGLVDLEELTLNNNQISDISHISHLENLYFLNLWSNPLNEDALAVHIPRIIANNPGIEIYYDQWIGSGLTVSSAHGGSVIQPGEGSFEYDGVVIVAIEAAADSSYSFVCWTGTAVEAGKVADPYSASTTVLVDGDYTLQANFQRADGSVYFADPNLQVCVEQALGVSNPMPEDMLRLTYLHRKDFPGIVIQDLTGLEYAKNLQELWLWGHQVEDLSPLADLTQLRVLDVGANRVWSISALYKLINLEELFIDNTEVQDISVLSNFTKLTGLDLSYTWFESLDVLEQLKHLDYLALEGDSIEDISILSNLTNLVQLNIAWNYVEDLSPLRELSNLMVLDLSYNEIIYTDSANYDLDISPLGDLTNLKELYLEGCSIWDLSPLSELTSLQILNLSNSVWDDLSPLSQLKQLTYLDLSGCDIEDVNMCQWGNQPGCYISGIDFISGLDNLEFVNLYFNWIEDISPLMGLTSLKVVDLRANPLNKGSCRHVQELIDRGVRVYYGGCEMPDNKPPTSPTLILPADGADVSSIPIFQLFATDLDNDSLKFRINILQNSTLVATFNQIEDPTCWDKVDYSSGQTATFILPESQALTEGTYEWFANVFDGKQWSSASQTWSFSVVGEPNFDLIIEDISIITSFPNTAENVEFKIKVKNLGSQEINQPITIYLSTEDFLPTGYLDTITIDSISANGSKEIEAEWFWVKPGLQTIYARVEPPNEIIESDESNNSAEQSFYVEGMEDDFDYPHIPASRLALIIKPYKFQNYVEHSDELESELLNKGYLPPVVYENNERGVNDEANIPNLINAFRQSQYGVIHFTTHGTNDGVLIETFETDADLNNRWDFLLENYYGNDGMKMMKELFTGDDKTDKKPAIGIRGDFIRHYLTYQNSHPIIYFESCLMGSNQDMKDAFVYKGAGCYVGFDKEVAICTSWPITVCKLKFREAGEVSGEFYKLIFNNENVKTAVESLGPADREDENKQVVCDSTLTYFGNEFLYFSLP